MIAEPSGRGGMSHAASPTVLPAKGWDVTGFDISVEAFRLANEQTAIVTRLWARAAEGHGRLAGIALDPLSVQEPLGPDTGL